MVIWLIGLAGAGKTVIGREVFARLRERKSNVVFLDGDDVREIMGGDLGHTVDDRRTNAWRVCRLCEYLDRQDIDVVCAILSIFHDTQRWNRKMLSQYFEVYIDVPMEDLIARDQKGLYSKALAGEITDVVGIDIPFETPPEYDLVVNNGNPLRPPAVLASEVVAALDGAIG